MVFLINIATVIGPTPPGTGVIEEHIGATRSKSTSPTKRNPGVQLINTNIDNGNAIANNLRFNKIGLPIAAIRMSACLVKSAKKLEWQKVTELLGNLPSISIPAGFPTIKRPRITTCFPSVSIRDLFKSSKMPAGVHDMKHLLPLGSLPRLVALNPSTSLSGFTELKTSPSIWCGRGA